MAPNTEGRHLPPCAALNRPSASPKSNDIEPTRITCGAGQLEILVAGFCKPTPHFLNTVQVVISWRVPIVEPKLSRLRIEGVGEFSCWNALDNPPQELEQDSIVNHKMTTETIPPLC